MGCRSLEADQQVPYPQARAPGRGDRGSSSDCSYSHERPPFVTRTASRQPLRVAPVVLCRATYLLEYDRPGLDDTPHGGSTGPVELSMTGSRFGGVNGPKRHLLRVECSAALMYVSDWGCPERAPSSMGERPLTRDRQNPPTPSDRPPD